MTKSISDLVDRLNRVTGHLMVGGGWSQFYILDGRPEFVSKKDRLVDSAVLELHVTADEILRASDDQLFRAVCSRMGEISVSSVTPAFKLEALGINVILKLLPKVTLKGSIILTGKSAEESDFCDIVAVGPDAIRLKVGDRVLRPSPAEVEWKDEDGGGQIYLIVPEPSITARVR